MQQLDPAIFGEPAGKKCSIDGCGKPRRKHGLCAGHAYRQKAGLPLDAPLRSYKLRGGPCEVAGCPKRGRTFGLCVTHYRRKRDGRADWDRALRPTGDATAHLGNPSIRQTTLELLDRQSAALRMTRLDLVRIILDGWARDVTARKREGM